MAEVNFGDRNAARKWFAEQSAEARCIMTSRAALRVAANLGRYDGDGAERLVLTALRSTLTSAVRGLGRTADVEWLRVAALPAARSALSAADSAARSALPAARSALSAADSAARSALSAARSAARSALSAADSADSAARSALPAARSTDSAMQWDSLRIEGDLNAEQLWAGAEVPPDIQSAHYSFLTQLRANPDWDFFRTWYAQMWEGTFTDWDLATEVAKIGDDVWKAGLAEVAEAIRGIEARFSVRDAISDFRGTETILNAGDAGIAPRGHNNPPELIEDEPLIQQREIVWAAISDLEREVAAENPVKAVVIDCIKKIGDWVTEACKYLGRKADLTIDQVIKWGVPLGGTYLLTHPAKLQAIVEAAKAWLPFLP